MVSPSNLSVGTMVPWTTDRPMAGADDLWIKVAGEQKCLFASINDDAGHWLAYDMAHAKFQHNSDMLLRMTL